MVFTASEAMDMEFLIIGLGLLQYPIYGFLIDLTLGTSRFKSTFIGLVGLHFAFFMLLLLYSNNTWR